MAKKLVITVTWIDGKTEVYDDVSSHHETDGAMTITGSRTGLAAYLRRMASVASEHPLVRRRVAAAVRAREITTASPVLAQATEHIPGT
jgi:hypothetical protein